MKTEDQFPLAPEFPDSAIWLNTEPLTRDDLKGRITLLCFWDYTNIHCLDSLAYVRAWASAYEPLGLHIIAVHAPAFEFAQSEPAVQAATRALNLGFPVVMDNLFKLWEAYDNQVWPSFYIIDTEARIVFRESGTSSYCSVEAVLQDLFKEVYPDAILPAPQDAVRHRDEPGIPLDPITEDFLTGYEFDTLGNEEGYEPHRVVGYDPHKGRYEEGRFYLEGKWLNQRNCVAVAKSHEGSEACIVIPYTAAEVSMVVHPAGEVGFAVEVTNDDKPLTEQNAGEHVRFVGEGGQRRSQLLISDSKMYRILRHTTVRTGLLRVYTRSSGFSVYAFTFVAQPCSDGEIAEAVVRPLVEGRAKARDSIASAPYLRPEPRPAASAAANTDSMADASSATAAGEPGEPAVAFAVGESVVAPAPAHAHEANAIAMATPEPSTSTVSSALHLAAAAELTAGETALAEPSPTLESEPPGASALDVQRDGEAAPKRKGGTRPKGSAKSRVAQLAAMPDAVAPPATNVPPPSTHPATVDDASLLATAEVAPEKAHSAALVEKQAPSTAAVEKSSAVMRAASTTPAKRGAKASKPRKTREHGARVQEQAEAKAENEPLSAQDPPHIESPAKAERPAKATAKAKGKGKKPSRGARGAKGAKAKQLSASVAQPMSGAGDASPTPAPPPAERAHAELPRSRAQRKPVAGKSKKTLVVPTEEAAELLRTKAGKKPPTKAAGA